MIVSTGIVKHFGDLVAKAESRVIDGMERGTNEEEDTVTDRFFGELERVFKQHGKKGDVEFHVRKLRGRGPDSPEKRYGADICGVLNVRFPNFQQSKGFLSQAKMDGRGIQARIGFPTMASFPAGNIDFNKQIDNMLSITPDSFVIVYSKEGFVVVPASSVQGLKHSDTVYGKPVTLFFKEFLMCFIGDPNLNGWNDRALDVLRERTDYKRAFLFDVTKPETAR